ncbi:SIR2 family protein [Pectobacterium sp. CHL-2024]|uniref:SIR2 family protein n=1 Tax=Pectobacterium sp. CHL-2024 TaxID=3377079 RepID=UPI00380F3804
MKKESSRKLEQKKRTVKDLADYIKTRSGTMPNYSLFLGAGASVTSGIKTAVELVDEWRKEIFERLSPSPYIDADSAKEWLNINEMDWYDSSNEYSSLFEKKFDLPAQRRRFVEEQVDKRLPSIGYAYLVELFDRKLFDTVFTTNFDDLINEAFYQLSAERPLLCAHDSSIKGISITSSRPKIIKLHGDYLFDGIKSSLNETESLEVNTKEKLIEFTKEYGLIFVGYAGNDKSIMEVINSLLKQDEYLKNGVYWCHRKNTPMSTELSKFLLRERVYLVEIEGFDELLAELFHEINNGSSLSFSGAPKSTKRERMIHNFISDDFNLRENNFIAKDLKQIRKHTVTQDISSLINDLSDDELSDDKIPEDSFRNLIYIDGLIKSKSYEQAESEIKNLLNSSIDETLKARYVQRLINIYEETDKLDKAQIEADKLIELDQFNIGYCLSKANLIPDLSDKIKYLKSLLNKFEFSSILRNELSRLSIKYIGGKNQDNIVTIEEIHSWLDKSLQFDGSLDNNVWEIKRQSIINKYVEHIDKTKQEEEINALILSMHEINPTHLQYISIKTSETCKSQDIKKIKNQIDTLNITYKKSSVKKRRSILDKLCSLHSSLFGLAEKDEVIKTLKIFFDTYSELEENRLISSFYTCKAKYQISYLNNISEASLLAQKAVDAIWANDEFSNIFELLSIDKSNDGFIEEYIKSIPPSPHDVIYNKVMSDYHLYKKNYDDALVSLQKAYENGLSYSSLLTHSSFINLCKGDYNTVIKDLQDNISHVKSLRDKNVLIVNRELAKKKLEIPLKDNELRSVISTDSENSSLSMCAHFILDETLQANRIMKRLIENDYANFYTFQNWPAVPKDEITKINPLKIVA